MRTPRVAILGYVHESNSFALGTTGIDAFEILRGDELVAQHAEAGTIAAGYLDATASVEAVPLMLAEALPSGPIAGAAYAALTEELLALLRARGPFDAVLLALHGAAVAEGTDDADGGFVAAVRAAIGPSVPLGVTLDLHANVSPQLVRSATVVATYQTNPHLDAAARAAHCAAIVLRAARGEVRPVTALAPVPIAMSILRMATAEEPMRSLVEEAARVAASPGVLSAGVAEGFPYADVPHMGMSCLVVADGDAEAAVRAVAALAEVVWARRHELQGRAPTAREAVAACPDGATTILLDVGDNVGGGSAGDSVVLLAEAIRQGVAPVAQTLHDPEAVAACTRAGAGARLALRLGSGCDPRYGEPVDVDAVVEALHDGRWHDDGPVHGGATTFDAGPSALVRTARGDALILTSRAAPPWSAGQWRALGVDLRAFRAIVAKGVVAPRATFRPYASTFVLVDTPGPTSASLGAFPYRSRPPMLPFDDVGEWRPKPIVGDLR